MNRPTRPGSAFRAKMPREPQVKDIEQAVLNSGLLGKTPSQYKIKYSKPSLADIKPQNDDQSFEFSLIRNGSSNRYNTITRPHTAISRHKPPSSARRRPETPMSELLDAAKALLDSESTPLSSKQTLILKPTKAKKEIATNKFYAKVLHPSDPPSCVNFIQLNEVLDRLMEKQKYILEHSKAKNAEETEDMQNLNEEEEEEADKETNIIADNDAESKLNLYGLSYQNSESKTVMLDDRKIYYDIFGEVIRQYNVECTDQSGLLDDCREYFSSAYVHIPKIKKHYDDIVQSVENQTKKEVEAMKTLGPSIKQNVEHQSHLAKMITDFDSDLKVLTKHHDELIKKISFAFNELMKLREDTKQLNNRLEEKNRKLMDLLEELRSLDSISGSFTADTLRFADNLKNIRIQQEKGRLHIQSSQKEIARLKESIMEFDKEIVHYTEEIEFSRIKPEIMEFGVQVDLISRRLFKTKKTIDEMLKKQSIKEGIEYEGSLFDRIRREYQQILAYGPNSVGNTITLNSYEDYAKFKKVLLRHEKEFHMSHSLIDAAQRGEFSIMNSSNSDYIRIFASAVVKNAISDAIQNPPFSRRATQTLQPQQKYEPEETNIDKLRKENRFLRLLNTNYSQRTPQSFDWLCTTIHELYDSKAIHDNRILENRYPTELSAFPEFIYNYAHGKFPVQFMADQFCWDVFLTSREHKGRTQEIDIFIAFLDETFNAEQLAFFLICRSDCLKMASNVTVYTRDQLETYNELYLSDDQIEEYLPQWWMHRYKKSYFTSIMELSMNRPTINLEATKRYCAMHDVLLKNVLFFASDSIERLRDLLLEYRITPRLNQKQFNRLTKLLIPKLKDSEVDEFHRATVTKSRPRTNISLEDFVEKFNKTSILINRSESYLNVENNEIMHETICRIWNENCVNLLKIYVFFQNQASLQTDNLTLKMHFDDSSKFLSNLKHSIATGDGVLSAIYYFQFMFSLDALFSTLNTFDINQESLISIECAIRENWLEKSLSRI